MRTLLVGAAMLVATPLGAGESLALKLTPWVCFAPANLIARATVVADTANRMLEISAESDDFYRSSSIQLEGDQAPRTTQYEFRNLPPGSYIVRAQLFGSDGRSLGRVVQEVDVLGAGGR